MGSPRLYYHPSRWAVIDDQAKFLRDLESRLPDRQLYRTFYDPLNALKSVNSTNSEGLSFPNELINHYKNATGSSIYTVKTEQIDEQILYPKRLSRFSVVVSDYLMPTLNGLELFKQLEDPHIKKVLLTGAADEKLAVEAFNSGLIDRFILKSHPSAIEQTWEYANKLQKEYFHSVQNVILHSISKSSAFLTDPEAAVLIDSLVASEKYVEYYFVSSPPGYLAFRGDGSCDQILIFDNRDIDLTIEYAKKHGAPNEIIQQLESKRVLGFFFEKAEHFRKDEYDWSTYLVKAKPVARDSEFFYAQYQSPPLDADYEPEMAFFSQLYQEISI